MTTTRCSGPCWERNAESHRDKNTAFVCQGHCECFSNESSVRSLVRVRHTRAHLLTTAIQEHFYHALAGNGGSHARRLMPGIFQIARLLAGLQVLVGHSGHVAMAADGSHVEGFAVVRNWGPFRLMSVVQSADGHFLLGLARVSLGSRRNGVPNSIARPQLHRC